MADDTRENDKNGTATAPATAPAPKKLPKGMIMGKDGKPCRTCNTLSDFRSMKLPSMTTNTLSQSQSQPPSDCPPDVEALGRSSWTLLHSITATYPITPTPTDQSNVRQFLSLFGKLYPCWVCAEDFQEWMKVNRVRTESREEFGRWMCEAHNDVNKKLGKKEFDCGNWEERWRTGWGDGRCD